MKIFIRSWCALLLIAALLRAQEDSLAVHWLEMAEKDPSVAEELQNLTTNPLNLNSARREDLLALPFLSAQTAEKILAFRRAHGSFKTIRPLRKILGTDLYHLVKPFFTTHTKHRLKGNWIQKNYFSVDPSKTAAAYEGNLWANYTRVEYAFNNKWSAGLLFRKEAGEPDWFDYKTAYIQYAGSGQWIIGNFTLQAGAGLLFGSPFSGQKSSYVLLPFRGDGIKLRPGLSHSINSLFGIAFTHRLGVATVAGFIAQNLLDGRLDKTGQAVIGFDYDDYHRTTLEQKGQNQISRRAAGISVFAPFTSRMFLAAVAAQYEFTPDIRTDPNVLTETQQRKDYFAFSGNTLRVFSLSYQYEDSLLLLSGEGAGSDRGGPAFAQKILLKTSPFRFGLMYWQASKSFQSPQGHFFDNSTPFPQAVQGWYAAGRWKIFRGLEVKGYKLLKKDLWRSYQNPMPQIRDEWLVQVQMKRSKQRVLLRLRQKKEDDGVRSYYRLHYTQQAGSALRVQTRVEYVQVHTPAEQGLYLFQDIRWRFFTGMEWDARFTVFNTSSFNSALYEYENDLPGSFSNYALYGKGHTWYILLRVRVIQNGQIWLKLRYLKRRDDALAPWQMKRDLRMGLRYRF